LKKNNSIKQQWIDYSKSQRIGLLLLVFLMIVLQSFYFFGKVSPEGQNINEKNNWLKYQEEIDSLKMTSSSQKATIYPFNPNFITDFKGYKLGMSTAEIDRLLAYRKQNKFVNSAEEFQQVTKVSDSLLNKISPFFKFPDWVKNKNNNSYFANNKDYSKKESNKSLIDINIATQEDLMKVYGIGEGLSKRILEQREKLGAFVSMDQMKLIWGLSPEVVEKLNQSFVIKSKPIAKKIRINDLSVKELSQFPYFRYNLAKEIVTYRSMNGDIKIEDLSKIKGFPVENINIIALYLEF
jgi:DNA uptake protein ComE-like DNA-binding protein